MADRENIPPSKQGAPTTTDYSTKPVKKWTKRDVANWIRKVLNYSDEEEDNERIALDKSLNIVMQQAINGAALLLFKDDGHLQTKLHLLDGHVLILWAEIEKMKKSLAEPEAQAQTNNIIAKLEQKIARTKKRKRDDQIVDEDISPAGKRAKTPSKFGTKPIERRILEYGFENRKREVEEFVKISITNLMINDGNTPSNTLKPTLIVASQMLGSGKTYFGQCVIKGAERDQEILKKNLTPMQLGYLPKVLSAYPIHLDMRYCRSLDIFPEFFLTSIMEQCPNQALFDEAKIYWSRQGTPEIVSTAKYFTDLFGQTLLFHFDEIDALLDRPANDEVALLPNKDQLDVYYKFWKLITPLFRVPALVYCSGRSPDLFFLGKKMANGPSPSAIHHIFFDRFMPENIVRILQHCVDEKKLQIGNKLTLQEIAAPIYEISAGIPRLVEYAILYLGTLQIVQKNCLGNQFLQEVFDFTNQPNKGYAELFAFKRIATNEKLWKIFQELVYDSILEVPFTEDQNVPEVLGLPTGVKFLHLMHQFGLYTAKTPLSRQEKSTSESPNLVFIVVPALVALAIDSLKLKNSLLFSKSLNEMGTLAAKKEERLEQVAKLCLQHRLASNLRATKPNTELGQLFPFLVGTGIANVKPSISGDIYCLPKVVLERSINVDTNKLTQLKHLMSTLENARNETDGAKKVKGTLNPEFPGSHWQAILNNFKPGMYAPADKSSSGDFYIVIQDPTNPPKVILLVFQFKSGLNVVFNFETVCSEAFKAIQLPEMTVRMPPVEDSSKKKATSVKQSAQKIPPKQADASTLPIDKSVSHVVFVIIGGDVLEAHKAKFIAGSHALRVNGTKMTNAMSEKKGAYSGQLWTRPTYFDIYVLTAAGRKHFISPYNTDVVGISDGSNNNNTK